MEISEETKKIEKALDENIIKLIDDVNSVWKQSNCKYQLSKELPKTAFKKSELIKGRSWGGGEYSFDTIRLDVGENGIKICVLNGEYYHASKGIFKNDKNDNHLAYSSGGHDSISTNNIDFKFFLAANADVILNITTELTNEYLQKQQIAAEKKVQETKDFEEHSKALAEELGIEPVSQQVITEDDKQSISEPTKIEVDGKVIECKNGLVEGFKNAVRQNNQLIKDYNSLVKDFNSLAEEVDKLRQQLQNHNHSNKPSSYS